MGRKSALKWKEGPLRLPVGRPRPTQSPLRQDAPSSFAVWHVVGAADCGLLAVGVMCTGAC